MTPSAADWDAAQARLQGLRSRRPSAAEWVALEATLGLDEYLARARQAPFGLWIESLGTEPALHEIDRVLRAAFRAECTRLASWYGEPWNRALAQLAAILDLPLLAALRRGAVLPASAGDDPVWRGLIAAPADERFQLATGLQPPPDSSGATTSLEDWARAWLAALPACTPETRAGFAALARAAVEFQRRGAAADRFATPALRMHERLALLFRRHAGTPVAMACEIAAAALDLQRLRAGLVRRVLAQRAASVAA
jgi:hypothetical protein